MGGSAPPLPGLQVTIGRETRQALSKLGCPSRQHNSGLFLSFPFRTRIPWGLNPEPSEGRGAPLSSANFICSWHCLLKQWHSEIWSDWRKANQGAAWNHCYSSLPKILKNIPQRSVIRWENTELLQMTITQKTVHTSPPLGWWICLCNKASLLLSVSSKN